MDYDTIKLLYEILWLAGGVVIAGYWISRLIKWIKKKRSPTT